MPKELAVLAAMLVAVLGMAAPALAQEQDEVPACVLANACGDKPGEHQYEPMGDAFSAASAPEFDVTPEAGNNHSQYGIPQGCSDDCTERVAQAAEEAIMGDGTDNGTGSEAGTDPADAFSAAINAALSPGGSPGSGDAAASEQTPIPVQGNEAVAYRAAFEAAKESGLDDEAATKAAGVAVAEASKTRKGGSPSEGIAAAEGKTRNDQASKKAAPQGKDREDKKSRKDKARDDAVTDDASEEETTEDTDEEVAASGEDGGTSGEDVATAPAGGRVPLLLGGVALLSIGGYAGLRFIRSWSPVRGRRLLRF